MARDARWSREDLMKLDEGLRAALAANPEVLAVLDAAIAFAETESALCLTNRRARALVRAVRKLPKVRT
jgi:hypothetical protein